MRTIYVLAIVTALVVVGALAQSESDYQSWMKSNYRDGTKNLLLRKTEMSE